MYDTYWSIVLLIKKNFFINDFSKINQSWTDHFAQKSIIVII